MPPPPPPRLPAIILAGGQARRMGGGHKGLIVLQGRPLVAHVLGRLAPFCDPVAINANGDPGPWAGLGLPVLADDVAGYAGPLAGVLAGLDWAAAQGAARLITAPADTPFLPQGLVPGLLAAAGPDGCAIAASADAAGALHLHPTCALWQTAARHDLRAALQGGMRRMTDWAAAQSARTARFAATTPDAFFNINTPDDAATAARLASAVPPGAAPR